MDNITLFSDRVWLAENEANGNPTIKVVLCDFSVNKNCVQLNRAEIENWMGTIVGNPIVGKVANGDFTGHNMKKSFVKDDDGNLVRCTEFDTSAFGVFTSVAIETIDDEECLVATADIWARYPRVIKLIKDRIADGTLHTSWEISVSQYRFDNGIKIIDAGVFTALAMLGKNVEPAYDSSRLLEVAEAETDDELLSAINMDLEENEMAKKKQELVENPESVVAEVNPALVDSTTDAAATEVSTTGATDVVPEAASESEVAALTVWDLRSRIQDACRIKVGKYCWVAYWFPADNYVWCEYDGRESELDYLMFAYTVEDDVVTVDDGTPVKLTVSVAEINKAIAEKDSAIAEATTRITDLQSELDRLADYKVKYEQAENERIEAEKTAQRAELAEYAQKSGFVTAEEIATADSEVAVMVSELNKDGINQLIATRFMASLSQKAVDTKTPAPVVIASLETEEVKPAQKKSVIKAYLGL